MQQPLRFLMCEPTFFEVSYVINPWMEGNVNRARSARAAAQWQRLFHEMTRRARVMLVAPQPGLPDMTFTANAAFVLENVALLSHFRFAERQGEEAHYERWFAAHGFSVVRGPCSIPFEGAGDLLIERGTFRVWAAWGHRSARESHDVVLRKLGVEVASVRLVDPRFYHLDTCFCPLEGGYIMYYPPAFDTDSNQLIERLIPRECRIAINEADALSFACNAVNIGPAVIVNAVSLRLRERLTSLGFEVVAIELTEFLKAGGAAKCLTLLLDEPRPVQSQRRTA